MNGFLFCVFIFYFCDCSRPSLQSLMNKYNTDKGYHHHYYLFYEPLFESIRDSPIRLLEIGVEGGRSMALWQEYFPNIDLLAGINYGASFDIKSCVHKIRCFNGDQSDLNFLEKVIADTGGNFHIIIDDGSHVPMHQFVTLNRLLHTDAIVPNGIYIVEDVETSYWRGNTEIYGYKINDGGLNAPCSFVERAKRFVDVINREFVNSNYHTTKDRIDHRISTIQFSHNIIIFRIATDSEILLMDRHYRGANSVDFVSENKTQKISNMCDMLSKSE